MWWWVVPVKNRGEHEIFANFLRTAGDKHGFQLSNMNNHHPKIMNSIRSISKVYRYRHQKSKLKIKCHLYLGDSCHQNIKRYVTWGLKSQKCYVFFPCNHMEPFISGVHPSWTFRAHNTKPPRGLCNGFTSGIKPSDFCTVLVCRG